MSLPTVLSFDIAADETDSNEINLEGQRIVAFVWPADTFLGSAITLKTRHDADGDALVVADVAGVAIGIDGLDGQITLVPDTHALASGGLGRTTLVTAAEPAEDASIGVVVRPRT